MPSPSVAKDPGASVAKATEELEKLIPEKARARIRVEVKIALGNVVQEILSVAQETQAGLIVLGVHAPAHSWLPGTEPAAYKILVSAPCPVISLRVSPALMDDKAEDKEQTGPLVFG
jgi:nucleotide-binding universal stress UspA family protein